MIKEQHFTIRAHSYNEDRFVVTKHLLAVIDGASGLVSEKKRGSGTDASRLAAYVKTELLRCREENIEQFLLKLSRRAYESGFNEGTSCGISVVQFCKDTVRFYTVGDCEIIYRLRTGEVSRFYQPELPVLDDKAIEQMVQYAKEHNVSVRDARPHIQDILIRHRALMNTPNGYNVFAPSSAPKFEVKTLEISRAELQDLYLCTDGFLPCFTELGIFRHEGELFSTSMSVKDICLQIQSILRQDKDYNNYPRFKLFDDITAIRAELE